MVDAPSNGDDVARRCSMAPVYVLGIIWLFGTIASISDLTGEVEEFITHWHEHCWAYSSMEAHNANNFGEGVIEAIIIMILWVLIQSGLCRLSLTLVSLAVLRWIVLFFYSESCGP